jgi:ribosomal protein S27E
MAKVEMPQSKIMWQIKCKDCGTVLEDPYMTRDDFEKFLEEEKCGECGGEIVQPLGVGAVFFKSSGFTRRGA